MVERLVIMAPRDVIGPEDLPPPIRTREDAEAAEYPQRDRKLKDARDSKNRAVVLGSGRGVPAPSATALLPAIPNPFRNLSTLGFSLAQRGPVELAIYSVDGRRVKTLVRETRDPGVYRVSWNGTDDRGAQVRPGLFFARLMTSQGRFTRTVVLVQ